VPADPGWDRLLFELEMPRGPKGEKRPALSPAMATGISDTLWEMTDLAQMIDAAAPKPGKRGPYKKRNSSIGAIQ
jgi:hypothetical protein